MTPERYNHLMNTPSESLTVEEFESGWHFCYDWDGLLIHKDSPEAEHCLCRTVSCFVR